MAAIRLDDGTPVTSQLLQSIWEMERRGYLFRWTDPRGLVLELAHWHKDAELTTRDMEHPLTQPGQSYLHEDGWEPIFVLDHLDEVAVLVQYQAHHTVSLH
jgi:hypothetical protein